MPLIFWQVVYVVFFVALFAVPVVAFRAVRRRMRGGLTTRLKGFVMFAVVALSPSVAYVLLFLSLVGIEELFGVPLIQEEMGRTFLLVVAFGLLVWLAALVPFAVVAARVRVSKKSDPRTSLQASPPSPHHNG